MMRVYPYEIVYGIRQGRRGWIINKAIISSMTNSKLLELETQPK